MAFLHMFNENDSEIETAASDCIGRTVEYILGWLDIGIDVETAIRERMVIIEKTGR